MELKYIRASWDGGDPVTGEPVRLRHHGADDLARHHFVADIARLEQICAAEQSRTNGLAIMLTNARAMWNLPAGDRRTRDRNFRIHEGRTLTGTLVWGEGDFPSNNRSLRGTYPIVWQPYSQLGGRNGDFRWLAIPIVG
ncbi:hypothetical protein O7635_15600 [Asanoa sp. WMMD1127]|uniref:hypothetical protein n=1 Tax=Asanoa sp. WMMD1127 TaxID=3016107 RepID=UPI002416B342|nr:hypothetical protein [Asanoa sp. WMMD1127]MDG4823281.1 hypothetical protein [Asanoa sp. WMMD1127]